MKIKRIILGITTGSLVAIPTIVAVSCGSSAKPNGTIEVDKNVFVTREKVENSLGNISKDDGWKSVIALDSPVGTVNDKSFNETSYGGMILSKIQDIMPLKNGPDRDPSKPTNFVRPTVKEDKGFVDMYSALDSNTLVVANGFLHVGPLSSTAGRTALENKAAILIDGDVKAKNIASLKYRPYQPGFLAGYMAGIYLNEKYETFKDGGLKVGTFGGMKINGVVAYMLGFQNGIKYFNANKGDYEHDIEFIDNGYLADYFSGNFNAGGGTQIAENLIGKGADLIFPVAGIQTKDVINKLKEAKNTTTKIVGVDVAQELDPVYKDYVVFSALLKMKDGVSKMIEIITGTKSDKDPGYNSFAGFGGLTIADLDNDLVGVSPGLQSDTAAKKAWDAAQKKEIKDAAKNSESNPLKFDF